MAKRILHKFKLSEISGVDSMAQEGAEAVILKRDNTAIAKGAFKDAVAVMEAEEAVRELWWKLWESETAMYDAISSILNNPSRYPDVQAAIIESLGEYSKEVQTLAASATKGDIDKSLSSDPPGDHPVDKPPLSPKEDNTMSKKNEPTVESLTADLQGVNASLAKSEAFGKLCDAERTHYASLDDAGKETFIKMDEDGRKAILKNLSDSDAVVFTSADGEEFRKSDDPRLVKMAKDRDEDRVLAKANADKAENLELAKRASDEIPNLPGDESVKVKLLKALGSLDKDTRTEVDKMLKAGNDAMSGAFKTLGTSDEPTGDADNQLDIMTKAYAKEHNVPEADAMVKVLETPEGEELYTKTQS